MFKWFWTVFSLGAPEVSLITICHTELMEVHNDDDVVDIINCVALYYEKGASGNAFRGKKNLELLFQGKWRPWKS